MLKACSSPANPPQHNPLFWQVMAMFLYHHVTYSQDPLRLNTMSRVIITWTEFLDLQRGMCAPRTFHGWEKSYPWAPKIISLSAY